MLDLVTRASRITVSCAIGKEIYSLPSSFPPFLLFQATSSLDSSARTLKIAKSLTRKRIRRYRRRHSLLSLLHSSLGALCTHTGASLYSYFFFSSSASRSSPSLPPLRPLSYSASPGMIPHSSRTGAVLDKRNVAPSIAALRGN